MSKGKSSQQSSKGKSATKSGSSKPRPAAAKTRSTSSSTNRSGATRTGALGKNTTNSTRSAFMRGARSRGRLGTWGLVGLLGGLVVFAVLYFTGVFNPKSAEEAQVGLAAEISVDEAYALYPDGAFFLDVREVVEWEAGYVPDTTNIPLSELESRLNELPTDQDIVVICRSGNRSTIGRDILLDAGFENVTSMADGVREWKASGHPFEGEVLED